jgi:hypothetical protein
VLLLTSLLFCLTASSDSLGTFEGTLLEPDGTPVIAAAVMIPGTRRGALSDENGHFRIPNVPPGRWILRYRSLGFTALEDTLDVAAGQSVRVHRVLTLDPHEVKKLCNCILRAPEPI